MTRHVRLTMYRVINKSGKPAAFDTNQGVSLLVLPGAVIDMHGFEVEGSESFERFRNTAGIDVAVNQVCSITESHMKSLQRGIRKYRGVDTRSTSARQGNRTERKRGGKSRSKRTP